MSLLALADVTKSFGGVTAVGGLSFAVRPRHVVGLMGPNGAGKTTIINLISGLLHPDAGTIMLGGQPVTHARPHEIAGIGLARTYQNVRLISGMTALEQVIAGSYLRRGTSLLASILHLPAARAAQRATRANAMDLLARVGMADRADTLAETLSYGEQRRIEIARALASQPKLLLLDEPTAGMNAAESAEIGSLVHALRDDGLTVLMVEHNMKLVADFCEHVVVMNFGRKIAEGPPAACIADPAVQEAYFGKQRDAQRHRA